MLAYSPSNTRRVRRDLRAHWESLGDAQQEQADLWYRRAHERAQELAAQHNLPLPAVCGVIAWLSPGVRWEHNLRDASEVCALGRRAAVSTYRSNYLKALDSLEHGAPTFSPRALKVSAFYDNILQPHASTAVTIDRWILRALAAPSETAHRKLYNYYADQVRHTAAHLGLRPLTLQAGVWISARGTAA